MGRRERLICQKCINECEELCSALRQLFALYKVKRIEEKRELLKTIRHELEIKDFETADDLRELAEKIIDKMPEVQHIKEFDIKVGYVRSYESKPGKKVVFADCRKITGVYTAYLPYDFIITLYPEADMLTENQKKIVMLHELKHIDIGEQGFTIRPHDIEDFKGILERFGISWSELNQDVPDILAGGRDGTNRD